MSLQGIEICKYDTEEIFEKCKAVVSCAEYLKTLRGYMYDTELGKLFPKLCAVLKYAEERKQKRSVILKVNIEDFDGHSSHKILDVLNGNGWIEKNRDRVEITCRTALPSIETLVGEPSKKNAKQ